ncbi:hypothetical protein N7465_002846 [Penicillium sp. CMV-2018d]|nr:hypothetical protein N7465_002846 [Penicillium sp. CMV-2018d]
MEGNTPAGLRKRGLNEEDNSSSPRLPIRRRLTSKSAEPAESPESPESPLPYPIPDDSSVSSDGKIPPMPLDDNEETLSYVQEILYPRHDVDWPHVDRIEGHVWEYGTEDYREILGTKLGNAAACLVLGAWERGTHRIARVHTLGRQYHIHLRFDIEPIPVSGTA